MKEKQPSWSSHSILYYLVLKLKIWIFFLIQTTDYLENKPGKCFMINGICILRYRVRKQQQQKQFRIRKSKMDLLYFNFIKKLLLLLNMHKNGTSIVLSLAIRKALLNAMKICWCDTIKCWKWWSHISASFKNSRDF